ncbi:MAG TPA: hypothetical protein VGE51_10560 [Fontimonas sp.]
MPGVADLGADQLQALLQVYGLQVETVAAGAPIPGSYWGDSEAGLIGRVLYVRGDTPVHSALHEACHYICMEPSRREQVHTNAGGDDLEETGVCYLQALLADELPGYGRAQLFADMDAWGYNFVLGSAQAWFERDADDARDWLLAQGIIDSDHRPRGTLRSGTAPTR